MAPRKTKPPAPVEPPAPVMSVEIANALVTSAPLTEAQLRVAIHHFAALHELLRISGPRMTPLLPMVRDLHKIAQRRLAELKQAVPVMQAIDPDLLPIEP